MRRNWAKKALENFIAGRPVTCKQVDYDALNNRPVAQCFAGEDDLQALMVSAGWGVVLWSVQRAVCAGGAGGCCRQARGARPSVRGSFGVAGSAAGTRAAVVIGLSAERTGPEPPPLEARELHLLDSVKLPICTGASHQGEPLSLRLIPAYP